MSRSYDDQLMDAYSAIFNPKPGPTADGKPIDFFKVSEAEFKANEKALEAIHKIRDAADDLFEATRACVKILDIIILDDNFDTNPRSSEIRMVYTILVEALNEAINKK